MATRNRACALRSPPPTQPGWGWGRVSRCRAPVVFHRGGCRRGSLSRAMRLLCWWQVLLWVLGLPAHSLEGECRPGRGRRLRGGDALLLARRLCGEMRGGGRWRPSGPERREYLVLAEAYPDCCCGH